MNNESYQQPIKQKGGACTGREIKIKKLQETKNRLGLEYRINIFLNVAALLKMDRNIPAIMGLTVVY